MDLGRRCCAHCDASVRPGELQVQVSTKPGTKSEWETVAYCSTKCLESDSANGRRFMEQFQPLSPSRGNESTCRGISPLSMGLRGWRIEETAEDFSGSSSRAAIEDTTLPKPEPHEHDHTAAVPFTHCLRKASSDMRTEALDRSVDVNHTALRDQYPMSQRVRSTSSFEDGIFPVSTTRQPMYAGDDILFDFWGEDPSAIAGFLGRGAPTVAEAPKPQRTHRCKWAMTRRSSLPVLEERRRPPLSQLTTSSSYDPLSLLDDHSSSRSRGDPRTRVQLGQRPTLGRATSARFESSPPGYHCEFETCGMILLTLPALVAHYQNAHGGNTPAGKEPYDAVEVKMKQGWDNTLRDSATRTDERPPVPISVKVEYHNHRPEIMFLSPSANSESSGSESAGGSEAMSTPKQREHLDTSLFPAVLAEPFPAVPKPSQDLFKPPFVSQLKSQYAFNQHAPPAGTPLNTQRGSVSISPVPSHAGSNHATKHERPPKTKFELMSSSTWVNTMSQLVGDDAQGLSKPGSIHQNSATCDVSESRNLACGIGNDYPVAGTEIPGGVQRLGQLDEQLAPVIRGSDARIIAGINPTSDMRTQVIKSSDSESGDTTMDPGIHEGGHKLVTLVEMGRGMSATPIISQACRPAIDQSPGSLVPPVLMKAFKSSKSDDQKMNAQIFNPSPDLHCAFRQLPPMSTGKCPYILVMVKCLAVLRAPEEDDQPGAVGHPELSFVCSSAHSGRRESRIIWVLALLHYYSLSWEPGGSSFFFEYGHASGSSEAPGGIGPRLEDGNGIQSGQGPGPGLQELDEFLNSTTIHELLGQGQNASFSKPFHDPINSPIPQQPDFPSRPPVPLDSYSMEYSAGYSVGHSVGHSAGHSTGYTVGYSDGVAHVYATLTRFLESAIQPLINQKALIQNSEAPMHADLAPLTPGMLRTALLAGLDSQAQTERITTINPESLPNAERESIDPNSSDGLPQNSATLMAPNAEHQISLPGVDPTSGLDISGPGVILGPDVQPLDHFDHSLPDESSSTNHIELSPMPAAQTHAQSPQSNQQPSFSSEGAFTSGASPGHEGTKTLRHRCACGRSFDRPYLLEDHKRIHTGEETRVYPCKFQGCTRVYTSYSNMHRHFKSHFRAGNPRSLLSMSDEQEPGEVSERPPVAGSSTHNVRSGTSDHHSGRGTSTLSDVRFRPYETPDTVRHKVVQRQK